MTLQTLPQSELEALGDIHYNLSTWVEILKLVADKYDELPLDNRSAVGMLERSVVSQLLEACIEKAENVVVFTRSRKEALQLKVKNPV